MWSAGQWVYNRHMQRRKPKAQRKEEAIRVRVTAEQKAVLAETAAREGLDVSAWLRAVGLREVARVSASA